MGPILLVASLTLLASFLCSLFEAVLYSITPSQLEVLKKRGAKGSKRLARLRADVESPIAAILTVNTVAHTVGAAWCGAMVGEYYDSSAVAIFAAIFTVLVLVITEIFPKSVGVRFAKRLGPSVAWPIQVMVWIAYPIARPARAAMRLLTGGHAAPGPTEEEVLLFSDLAVKHGQVIADEHGWMRNALRLDRITAGELRTPRTVVETRSPDELVSSATQDPSGWSHSRIPLVEGGNPDKVIGLVYRREVFDAALARRSDQTLGELMHPIRFVPEAMPAHELLELFLRERRHMCAIADEFGGFEGVVTLEDVLEYLVGVEIVDEHDSVDDMREMARRRNRHENDSGNDPEESPERGAD